MRHFAEEFNPDRIAAIAAMEKEVRLKRRLLACRRNMRLMLRVAGCKFERRCR